MLTLLSTGMGAGELSAPFAVDSRDSSTCQNRAKHTTRREVEGPPKLRVGRAGRFKCLMAHPFESWGGGGVQYSHTVWSSMPNYEKRLILHTHTTSHCIQGICRLQ